MGGGLLYDVVKISSWNLLGKYSMAHILSNQSHLWVNSLKGFATFWEFSFYGQKKVADYEYYSLFAEKIHFHT